MNNDISKLRMRLEEIQTKLTEKGYDGLFISIPQYVRHVLTGNPKSDLLSRVQSNKLVIESGLDDIPGYLLITKERTIFATYWYQFDQSHIEILNRPNISISSIGMTIDESNESKGKQQQPLVDIISISLDAKWIIEVLNQFHIRSLGWDGCFSGDNSWMPKDVLRELIRIQNRGKIFISPGINVLQFGFNKFS